MRAWVCGTAAAAASVVSVSACGSFSEAPSPTPLADAAATPTEAASDATADATATELLANPDFELTPCADWEVNNGTLSASSVARNGAASCKVCRDKSGSSLTLFQSSRGPVALPGERYRFTIAVRTALPDTIPKGLRMLIDFGANDRADIDHGAPTDAWREIAVAGQVTEGGDRPKVELRFDSSVTSDCILVDDASLVRVP